LDGVSKVRDKEWLTYRLRHLHTITRDAARRNHVLATKKHILSLEVRIKYDYMMRMNYEETKEAWHDTRS
jgi:hypothetical protein